MLTPAGTIMLLGDTGSQGISCQGAIAYTWEQGNDGNPGINDRQFHHPGNLLLSDYYSPHNLIFHLRTCDGLFHL